MGYTADDPPVQYLLEALNKRTGDFANVYAFQSGGPNDAAARWRHKGVEAIAYETGTGHGSLWQTLEAWGYRAKDPDRWYSEVVELSKRGPETLAPHERGQIAHVVSTYEGLKKFSEGDKPPPAEWLCVFDSSRRYAKPGHLGDFRERGPYVDPFDAYGLDSDIAPKRIDPEQYYANREVPPGAWDAFALNQEDRNTLREENLPSARGSGVTNSPSLTARLAQSGVWLREVASQPAAVWWASHQSGLHRDLQEQIRWKLERSEQSSTREIRQAWHYLFEAWEQRKYNIHDWYKLKAVIEKDGWDSAVVRHYARIRRPYLEVGGDYWTGPKPPRMQSDFDVGRLIRRDVNYPERRPEIQVPDPWVAAITKAFRSNLELALILETEIGGYGLDNISSLIPDEDQAGTDYGRTHGLSAAVIEFSSLFDRLSALDVVAARQEFDAWPVTDDSIFSRLRIWAAAKPTLMPSSEFASVVLKLSDKAFWAHQHQRDLLLSLAERWNDLGHDGRSRLERRLISGPAKWQNEPDDHFEERKAWSSLNRIHWLHNKGCQFSFNMNDVTKTLRSKSPGWKPEYANDAVQSVGGRGGWVRTETDHSSLLNEPLVSILSRAIELSEQNRHLLTRHDPYAGLAAQCPIRAFSALSLAARKEEFPEWAWETFLVSEARKNDKLRFVYLIAERLTRYSDSAIGIIIRPCSDWLLKIGAVLAEKLPQSFDKIVRKLVAAAHLESQGTLSAIGHGNKDPEWAAEAINAPIGKIALALFYDPRTNHLNVGQGFSAGWLHYLEELLKLPGDMRRHAIVIYFRNLSWFYTIDPSWTERNLLSVFKSSDAHDREAAWAGFLWAAQIPAPDLFMKLKPGLLEFAEKRFGARRQYGSVISGIILAGWTTIDPATSVRCISNDEMRWLLLKVDDELRSQILWEAQRRSKEIEAEAAERWASQLTEFLERVWPRQIAAKSPAISARLVALAFSDKARFAQRVEVILPLLTKLDRGLHLSLLDLNETSDTVIDSYPKHTLALLHAVLPDDARAWPYGIEAVLRRIGEADSSLNADGRLIALKHRWDAR